MTSELRIVDGQPGKYVALGRSRKGRLFRKEILKAGKWKSPNGDGDLDITHELMDSLVANFSAGVCDIVQFPLAGDDNSHTEDPLRNAGEVIALERHGDSLLATIDVRREDVQPGSTLIGASAMFSKNYTDTKTGEKVGATLLHVCGTNRPYINGLGDFEEIIAATAEADDDPIVLSIETAEAPPKEKDMTLEEITEKLKSEHNIDLTALTATASKVEKLEADLAELSKDDDDDEPSPLEVAVLSMLADKGLVELSQTDKKDDKDSPVLVALTNAVERIDSLEGAAAETEVNALIQAGKILPKQKDVMVKLARTDRASFEAMIPDDAIISLTENGVTTHEDPATTAADIDRYATMANGSKES